MFLGDFMFKGTSHQNELERLGLEIVAGSDRAVEAKYNEALKSFHDLNGVGPTPEDMRNIIDKDKLDIGAVWGIGPSGASEVGSDEAISLSEFVGGIAVANNIDPKQRDIDTVVYFIGKYVGALEQ